MESAGMSNSEPFECYGYSADKAKAVMKMCAERYREAQIVHDMARGAWKYAKANYVWAVACDKYLFPPCDVIMDFQEGPTKVRFEKINPFFDDCIVVRHYTTKGKLCKGTTNYSWEMVNHISRIQESDEVA